MKQPLLSFKQAGKILSDVFAKTIKMIKPGLKLSEIDRFADNLITKAGCYPCFKSVGTYQWATCINLNQGIVHGIPDETVVQHGDLLSLDMGLKRNGFNADMAYTIQIGKVKDQKEQEQIDQFLDAGKKALSLALKKAKHGNYVADISSSIEKVITSSGFNCSRELTGHGIGRNLHQRPWIPCVFSGNRQETPKLKKNMGLAIEVMYVRGNPALKKESDGWTISTQDGKISALFEKTAIVGLKRAKVITPYQWGELIV